MLALVLIVLAVLAVPHVAGEDVSDDQRAKWAWMELRARLSYKTREEVKMMVIFGELRCVECDDRVAAVREGNAYGRQWSYGLHNDNVLILRHSIFVNDTGIVHDYELPLYADTDIVASSVALHVPHF